MHIGSHYKISEFLLWTRRDIYVLVILATIPTVLFQVFDLKWIAIPWVPVALVGTAAAFIVGFKNTQTYNRLWEARQIWGGIVNTSRTWGIMSKDFIQADKAAVQTLIYRHLAWLTALRFQLRKPQSWENSNKSYNIEYRNYFTVPEWNTHLEDELQQYLSSDELEYVVGKKNKATQIIALQSRQLKALKAAGKIDHYEYVEMERRLADLYDHQGKCERIKNFPYPRQFASINLFFVWLMVLMLPYGMLNEFQKLGDMFVWLTIPFSVIVSWVFTSMEKVGEATENPFEGGANDIPMAALSRTIEIDLRDMLDEKNLPDPVTSTNNILM
jgi:putative membrane protein